MPRASTPDAVATLTCAVARSTSTPSTPSTCASAVLIRRAQPPQRMPATWSGVHTAFAGTAGAGSVSATWPPQDPPHDAPPPHEPPHAPPHPAAGCGAGAAATVGTPDSTGSRATVITLEFSVGGAGG